MSSRLSTLRSSWADMRAVAWTGVHLVEWLIGQGASIGVATCVGGLILDSFPFGLGNGVPAFIHIARCQCCARSLTALVPSSLNEFQAR